MPRLYVPATIANLGSGFDSLGAALGLYLEVEFREAGEDSFLYEGEGRLETGPENAVHQAARAAFATAGREGVPLAIRVFNPIPLARGMGSSAAARVAGAMIADRLLGGSLGREGVFEVATRLEGHPDNVAPAVYGGFQLALQDPPRAVAVAHPDDLLFVLAVPGFELSTSAAREALPDQAPLADAVFNLARAALWPLALAAGDLELMREAARDRLHQPYRLKLMPGARAALEAAAALGAPAFVAGAGPTVAAITRGDPRELVAALSDYAGEKGKVFTLSVGEGASWKAT
ncbi:homoserine kinase [Oceanithermus sp.]